MQLGTSPPERSPYPWPWLPATGLLIAAVVVTTTGVAAQSSDLPGTGQGSLEVGVPTAYVSPERDASIALTVGRIIDPIEVAVEAPDGERSSGPDESCDGDDQHCMAKRRLTVFPSGILQRTPRTHRVAPGCGNPLEQRACSAGTVE